MDDVFEVRSYCKICHTNCGILVKRDAEANVLGVRGDPENPRSRGYICPKGIQAVWAHKRPDRLNRPLLHGVETDWDTFLDDLAEKIRIAVATHGPDAVGIYGASGCDDLGWDALNSLLNALGSTSLYTAGTVDVAPDWKAAELVTGHAFGVEPQFDVDDEDVKLLLMLGTNPPVAHGGGFTDATRALKRFRAHGRVWLVDPVNTRTAAVVDGHLRPIPGSDPLILAWLVRELLEALPSESPVREKTKTADLERLREGLRPFDLKTVTRITDVDEDALRQLLTDIRAAGRINVISGTGTRFGPHGLMTEWLRWALLIVTDSLEEPGGMWISPGWQMPVEKRPWNPAPEEGISGPPIASRPDLQRNFGQIPCIAMADEIEKGPLRVFFVNGGNPLTAFPDPARIEGALRALDAFVVLDVVPTSATEVATHVMACTGRLERMEYNPIQSGRPQFTPAIVEPTGDRWHSWYIIGQLAKRLGHGDKVFGGLDPDTVTMDQLYEKKLANARHSWEELKQAGSLGLGYQRRGVRWARETAVPEGKWRVAPPVLVDRLASLLEWGPTEEFPLLLMSGRQERRMNTTDNVDNPKKADKAAIHVSPEDAERYGVSEGGLATLRNNNGRVTAPVTIDKRMRKGALTLPHGWIGANVTNLTSNYDADPLHGQPQMTAIPVMLEPAAANDREDLRELVPAED
ncbi:MAG TPA: molybdopterin dinucleotide binding domain-containing protein [Novosphingobium sp.]|nr:molybdopterin dinucleotide binding domain-containing protein [Novosphingobium sp.]